MVATERRAVSISIRKLAVLTAALVPLAFALVLLFFWLHDHIPRWVYWQIALDFLIAVKLLYWAVVVLTAIGIVAVGVIFSRHRQRLHRPTAFRVLVLGVSLALGLMVAETTCAIWRYESQKKAALPIQGASDNPRFERLRRTARSTPQDIPLPTTFTEKKPAGEIHLVVLGESSAEGVPYNFWVSIGQILAWQLNQRLPGRPCYITTLATSGDTLEKQHAKLANIKRRPDVIIIYCGHNEFSARFGPSRDVDYYFDARLPSVWSVLGDRIRQLSPLTALIDETADKCRIAIPPAGNQRSLVDVPVYTSSDYQALQSDFDRRLNSIVAYAAANRGVTDSDRATGQRRRIRAQPFVSSPGHQPRDRAAFRQDFLAARQLETSDPRRSLEQYRHLLASQPKFAETHYRIAQLLERDAAWEDAYEHYVRARDLDGYPMRMPSVFQDVYREVAAHHDCILIDSQAYFHAIGRHGLLDDNFFHDQVHPSLRGQIALAQAVLQALCERRSFGLPADSPASVIDPGECVKHFGIEHLVWRRICLWGIMVYGATAGARYDPSARLQMKLEFATAANRIEAGEAPESVGLPNIGVPAPVPLVPMP